MNNYQCLLLDQALQPLKAVSWQKAITLLSLGKIEVISEYDGFVRSPTLVLKMPAVARLLRVFKRFRKPVKFSRISIFARDKFYCQYCGNKGTINNLTYDHVIPRGQGGKTEWGNIVSCCGCCNKNKANRTPAQANMKLLNTPKRPNWVPAIEIQLSNQSFPNQWREFLYWTTPLDQT
jgi:5-methylcytosine-specific restriction endonuclease McrA